MAISPKDRYPAQIDISDLSGYPRGKARDVGVSGDGSGTPWQKDLVNDLFGFQQALLAAAGATPSGTPDKVGASQYLDAIKLAVLHPSHRLSITHAPQINWHNRFEQVWENGAFTYVWQQVNVTDGGLLIFDLPLPPVGKVQKVVAVIDGGSGHGALPSSKPILTLSERTLTIGAAAAGLGVVDAITDPSATVSAYENLHEVTLDFTGNPFAHNVNDRYFVSLSGEEGSNAQPGLRLERIYAVLVPS